MVRLSLPLFFFILFFYLVVSLDVEEGKGAWGTEDRGLIKKTTIECWYTDGVSVYRTSLVYALQNWLSESPDQAAKKPGSNPGILGVAMGLMAVFVVCLSPFSPAPTFSQSIFYAFF